MFEKIRNSFQLQNVTLGVLLLGIFFVPLFTLPFFRDNFNFPKEVLLYTLLSLLFLLYLFQIVKTRTLTLRRTVLDIPFLLLLLCSAVSTVFSPSPGLSFWGRSDTYVFHFFSLFLFLFWSWFLIQQIQTEKFFRSAIFTFLLSGTFASLFFLANQFSFVKEILALSNLNPVSQINSVFGFFMVVLLVVSLGSLIPRGKMRLRSLVLPIVSSLVSLLSLLFLDFYILYIALFIGSALLFFLAMAFWGGVRKTLVAAVFVLFLFSLTKMIFPQFLSLGKAFPSEVNLSPQISFQILQDSITHDTLHFLVGSGPASFVYEFSLFRPAILNVDSYFWSLRFDEPYSSLFAWVIEFGFLGTIILVLLILLLCGLMLSAALHIRSGTLQKTQFLLSENHFTKSRFEYFVFMIGWVILTFGLCVSVYNFSMWFLWWTLMSFVVIGLSHIQATLIRDEKKIFSIEPQYIFAVSFFFLLLCALTFLGGAFLGKNVAAEYWLSKSEKSFPPSIEFLQKARHYRPKYSEYSLLLSRAYLEESSRVSAQNSMEGARLLALSIDAARSARQLDPENVKAVELLAAGYIQTFAFIVPTDSNNSFSFASEVMQKAIELEPTNPLFHSERGLLFELVKEKDQAEQEYLTAIHLKSDYLKAYFDLARLYEGSGEEEKAIALYEQYMQIDSNNGDVLYELGRLSYNQKTPADEQKALNLWKRVVESQFSSPLARSNALYSLGLLFEKRGEKSVARGYFEKVLELNPENIDLKKKLESL